MNEATTIKDAVIGKMKGSFGFPKKIRVKKESEFNQIIKKGSKKLGENLVLYRFHSSDEGQKFGIKISRGVKGSVKRNRIKRIIRETLRKNKEEFDSNEKVVVLVKSPSKGINRMGHNVEIDLGKLKEELENLIEGIM
jgi:ribonuclease P protein component